jgi:hypothetical protein
MVIAQTSFDIGENELCEIHLQENLLFQSPYQWQNSKTSVVAPLSCPLIVPSQWVASVPLTSNACGSRKALIPPFPFQYE